MIPKVPSSIVSKEAKKIWNEINQGWDLDESGLITLKVALEAYQEMQIAQGTLKKEGYTYKTDNGQIKKHPAVENLKIFRSQFLMAWRMLGLDIEPPGTIGRPGKGGF